jgi:hypothetical protein
MNQTRIPTQQRFNQVLLIASTLAWSWLAMQGIHEFGHVLHAWSSGGRVVRFVLHPLVISRTDVDPNPHPQFVAWGGPIWGAIIPLAAFGAVRSAGWTRAWLARFFTGFCLVANGAYLLGGSFFPVGDAEVLLREGAPRVALAGAGLIALVSGFVLWNGIGSHFGLGQPDSQIDARAAWWVAAATAVLIVAECLFAVTSAASPG